MPPLAKKRNPQPSDEVLVIDGSYEILTETNSYIVNAVDIVAAAEDFSESYPDQKIISIRDVFYSGLDRDITELITSIKNIKSLGAMEFFMRNHDADIEELKELLS